MSRLGLLLAAVVTASLPGRGDCAEPPPASTPAGPEGPTAFGALIDAGRYADAEAEARRILASAEATDGPDSLAAATALGSVVTALLYGGRAADPEARRLAERAVAITEKALGPEHPRVADCLGSLSSVLSASGDYIGARPLLARALAIREKALGPEHPDVAQSLNNLASLVDLAEARALYERSLAIMEKARGSEHPDVARSLFNLASLLHDSGDPAGARPLLERALAIQQETLAPDHPDLAVCLNLLASVLHDQVDYVGARALYERALAISEKALGPDHPQVAVSLSDLASLLQDLGDTAGARPLLERALAVQEMALGPDHPAVARTLSNLAHLLRAVGDHAAARPLFERSLEIREKTLGSDHPDVANSLNNLASIQQDMGDAAAARPLLERALAINEKALGPWHPDVALSVRNLATFLKSAGDFTAARALYERSLAIVEKTLGPDHPNMARILNDLASVLRATDDDAGARRLYDRSLAINEKALGPEHPQVATTLRGLAGLLRHQGDLAGAEQRLDRALAIDEKALGAAHPGVAANLTALASLRAARGETALALEAALRAEQVGRDHARLTFVGLSERQALQVAAARAAGLGMVLSLAATGLEPAAQARAWDAAVRSRALVLDEVGVRHRSVAGATPLAPAAQALASAAQRLATLTVRGPGGDPPERYRERFDKAVKEREQAERTLAEQSVSFREERTRSRVGFAEVARALSHGEALVAYCLYERQPVGNEGALVSAASRPVSSYMAFVLRGGEQQPAAVALGTAREIDALVSAWRLEAARPPAGESGDADVRPAGEALRRALWDPLAPRVKDARRVLIVPDGTLHLVSFAALPAGGEGEYLVEGGATLHYLSAERDLVPSTSTAKRNDGLLALGGPAFDEPSLFASLARAHPERLAGLPSTLATLTPFRGETSRCASFESLRFPPLPAAASEAADVATLWQARRVRGDLASDVSSLSGASASEAALKAGAAGQRVLHLATHGFFLGGACEVALEATRGVNVAEGTADAPRPHAGENPLLLSGLALAGANRRAAAGPNEEDGILTAEEIASLDLAGVEWAVLSACDTGLGDIKAGEGVFGLRRAFQVAGARTVIMSLWPVEDESARPWMKALYEARLARGLDTAECVRDASLAVLRDRRARGLSTQPFYWAGFVAAGDWR